MSFFSSCLLYDLDIFRPAKRPRRIGWLHDFVQGTSSNLTVALKKDKDSRVSFVKDKFQANFDVQHFKPDEICVKVSDDKRTVIIDAKHEEREDQQGQVYRHFVTKYTLPKDSVTSIMWNQIYLQMVFYQ